MRVKVKVVELSCGGFELHTERGHRVGPRLLSVAPEENFPEIPEEPFKLKHEATVACMQWNLYLLHAWKHKTKSKQRLSE